MAPHDPQTALVRAAQAEAKSTREKALLRALFETVPAEDIEAYRPSDLVALARDRLAFISERSRGAPRSW